MAGAGAGLFGLGGAAITTGRVAGARELHLDELPVPSVEDRAALMRHFLIPEGLAYMNNGSLGPCPRSVIAATLEALRQLERNPVDEYYGPLIQRAERVRAQAAEFLGCGPDEIAITDNTTQAMNTIAQGLDLQRGDRVLTTDHEHPGGSVCWEYYARRRGVQVDRIRLPVPPASEKEILGLLAAKLTPQTRVISVSHVTFTTGLRMPVRRIAALAGANGSLLVVDGAQAPGVLQVNVKELGCDAYATSAHKWMLSPKGTGLLYISSKARESIDPLLLQHGPGVYTASVGTRNLPAVIGLGAAMDFLNAIGRQKVEERALRLRQTMFDQLTAQGGVRPISPPQGEMASALTTFQLPPSADCQAFGRTLRDKHRIIVKAVPHWGLNGIRVSAHLYNSEDDVGRLIGALREELA